MHWELVYLFVCLIITNPLTKFHQILIRKLDQENVLGMVDFFYRETQVSRKIWVPIQLFKNTYLTIKGTVYVISKGMHVIILCTIHISVFQLRNKAVSHSFVIRQRFNVVKITMLGTFPKDVFQVETSQRYFLKWQLPKCAISQAETSQVCPGCITWHPSEPRRSTPQTIRASALGPLGNYTYRKLPSGKLSLGKQHLVVPNTPAIYQGRITWKRTYSPFNQILN